MEQVNKAELTFDPNGIPPSQAEIDAYIETLPPKSKAAKRKSDISLAACLLSAFGFIFIFSLWLTHSPAFSGAQSFVGPALLSGVLVSAITGYYLFALFDLTHSMLEQKIDNSAVASLDLLEELLGMVTKTGIRPIYLTGVTAQERELTVSEVLNLKTHILEEQSRRNRAQTRTAIKTAMGITTDRSGLPSDTADTNNDPIKA